MKKRFLSVLLCLCMAVGMLPTITPTVQASTNGHTQAEAVQWAKDRANEHWEINDGSGMTQCTEFVAAYYQYLGGPFKVYGDAYQYLSDDCGARLSGWTRPDKNTVQPGDIVIWDKNTNFNESGSDFSREYGHIGIVISVDGNSMVTAEANAYGSTRGAVMYRGTKKDGDSTDYRDVSCISGLIRPDWPSTEPPPPDPTPTKGTYGSLTYEIQFGHVGIIGCDKSAAVVEIPSQIDNLPVTYIGDLAFYDCTSLTSITIPNSVTKIGGWAFSNCTGLTSITIPNSVTDIGIDAFSGCTGLTSVTIPNSVTSLTGFSGCTSLTSITIPNSVTSIGLHAFADCTGLTNVTIPNSVTSIGNSAFDRCSGLINVTIPNSVTSIWNSAFASCTGLTSITIPNSVTSIGDSAFGYCSGLTSITIPNSVTSVMDSAFFKCTGLTSVTIPNSVTSIGNNTFSDCTSLASITIPNSVTSIGDYAFSWCTGLTDVYYGGTESQWKAVSVGAGNSSLRNATIHYMSIGTISFQDIVQQLVGGIKDFLGFITIRCPVDAEVYIGDQLVGRIVNNAVSDVVSEKVYIGVEDDAKYVYFLTSEEYTIKLTATGTGTMEYTAQNLDVPSWTTLDGKYFRQVSLTPDKKMVSYINYLDDELVDTPNVQLYVLDDAGKAEKVVLPDDKGTEVPINTPVITFDSGVSSISVPPMAVGADGTLSQLPAPTRSGYTLNGWYTASSGGDKITTGTVFSSNTTVYAQWTYVGTSTPINPSTPSNPGEGYPSNYNPPAASYSISVPSVTGGTVSASPTSASSGSTVTVIATPDAGYELAALTVSDASGNLIDLTTKGNGQYSFKMPSGKVSLNAEFRPISTVTPWNNPYADVSLGDWYYDAVKFVSENGLMNGAGDGFFAPHVNLSRAMLAEILYNKEGRPAVTGGSAFPDVQPGAWYADAVAWASQNGIVDGYGNGFFGPNDDITREQVAVMLYRYAGRPVPPNLALNFSDANKVSSWAQDAVRWAVDQGILNGKGNGILDPTGKATRAEMAQMLKNYFDK